MALGTSANFVGYSYPMGRAQSAGPLHVPLQLRSLPPALSHIHSLTGILVVVCIAHIWSKEDGIAPCDETIQRWSARDALSLKWLG